MYEEKYPEVDDVVMVQVRWSTSSLGGQLDHYTVHSPACWPGRACNLCRSYVVITRMSV